MITVYGANTSLEGLRSIPLVAPEKAGQWWQGIQHGELADTLIAAADRRGWEIKSSAWSVGGDGADLAGAIDFSEIAELESIDGLDFAMGVLHDNRRNRALRIYVGGRVSICSNGLATGEIILKHKHTPRFNLQEEVMFALDDYVVSAKRMKRTINRLRERDLVEAEAEHLILEAGRQGLMPWSRLADVDREYRVPRFGDEFGSENSWSLLNAFTWVVKRNPIAVQMDQINQFRSMLPLAA